MDRLLEEFISLSRRLMSEEKEHPVAPHVPSKDIPQVMDLKLGDEPLSDDQFLEILEKLILHTPRVATKGFFNQLFGGRNADATLGELLTVLLNNSMYTYKAAGPMVAVEKEVVRGICDILGWDEQSGGILAPGGSMANLMAMIMARDGLDNMIKQEGIQGRLTAYTSEYAHYSIPKNASFCGIGRDQVRAISTDSEGRMKVSELIIRIEQDIQEGNQPFFVNTTAGTTVLGAFDPIKEIQEYCEEKSIWLHVDGAYCGAVIFSPEYRHLIEGVQKANSFCLNAHKMLGTPLSCSILLTENSSDLYRSFSNDASYLYQTDSDDFNLGKISMQCGRRNDALKLWTLWKRRGTSGLAEMINHQFDLAQYARNYIKNHPDYTLHSFEDSISVCFNYKNVDPIELCTKLYHESELMVGYGSHLGQSFIRLVTVNSQNSVEEIKYFFDVLESCVEQYF